MDLGTDDNHATSLMFFMLYHIDCPTENNSKFILQINAVKNMGVDVWYWGYSDDGIYLCHDHEEKYIMSASKLYRLTKINAFARMRLYKALIKYMQTSAQHFNMCYVRSSIATPSYCRAFKLLRSTCSCVVTEIPTFPTTKEQRSDTRWWRKPFYLVSNYFEKKSAKFVDLFVLIGEKSNQYLGRPAINIINGTQVSAYTEHPPKPENGCVHILALANMMHYHGYDRLIRGIYEYRERGGDVSVYLHLVGPDGDGSLAQWKALTKELSLEEYVLFEGSLYGDELNAMVDSCDVAADSLSAFKKDMHFGICLKVAEYCSRGIPFICCKPEDDQEFQIPHCLGGIPEDDSPVDMERVIAFVRQEQKAPNVAEELRAYAKGLSWEAQFTKICDYFDHLKDGDAL